MEKPRRMYNNNNMIPKVINYCWFGGKKKPKLVKKCIKSWRKYAPDFKVVEWNESNFNINSCLYCKEAYLSKKWAFVSDFVRINVLCNKGGIYLDTDYELIKPISTLCNLDFFSGFEDDRHIGFGFFGASANNEIIIKWLEEYKERHFIVNNVFDLRPIGFFFSDLFDYKKLESDKCKFFDRQILYPDKDLSNAYGIHHYQASWLSPKEKFIKFIGPRMTRFIVSIKHLFK